MIFSICCFLRMINIQKEACMILQCFINASSWHWNLSSVIFSCLYQLVDMSCERFWDSPPHRYKLLRVQRILLRPKALYQTFYFLSFLADYSYWKRDRAYKSIHSLCIFVSISCRYSKSGLIQQIQLDKYFYPSRNHLPSQPKYCAAHHS